MCSDSLWFLSSCTSLHRQLLQEPPVELKDLWFQDHDGNKAPPSLEQQERGLGPPQLTCQAAQTVPSHLHDNKMSRAGQPRSTAAWCVGQLLHPGEKKKQPQKKTSQPCGGSSYPCMEAGILPSIRMKAKQHHGEMATFCFFPSRWCSLCPQLPFIWEV